MTYDPIRDILTLRDGTQISDPRHVSPLWWEIYLTFYA